jgi:biopolymer transport protein ExbD
MKKSILLSLVVIGFCASLFADEKKNYPQISFVLPSSSGSSVSRDQFITLVVEQGFISHEEKPIPADAVVAYVDNALKAQNASYIGVYIREGIKFGDVVKALDVLRHSTAKSIGVSMAELSSGKRP